MKREEMLWDLQKHSVHDLVEEYIIEILDAVPTRNRAEEHLLRMGLEGKAKTPLFHDAQDGRSFLVLTPLPPVEPRTVNVPVLWFHRGEMESRLQRRGCATQMSTHEVVSALCGITGDQSTGGQGDYIGLFRTAYPELSVYGDINAINQADEIEDHWYALCEVQQSRVFWAFDAEASDLWVFTRIQRTLWNVLLFTI